MCNTERDKDREREREDIQLVVVAVVVAVVVVVVVVVQCFIKKLQTVKLQYRCWGAALSRYHIPAEAKWL